MLNFLLYQHSASSGLQSKSGEITNAFILVWEGKNPLFDNSFVLWRTFWTLCLNLLMLLAGCIYYSCTSSWMLFFSVYWSFYVVSWHQYNDLSLYPSYIYLVCLLFPSFRQNVLSLYIVLIMFFLCCLLVIHTCTLLYVTS